MRGSDISHENMDQTGDKDLPLFPRESFQAPPETAPESAEMSQMMLDFEQNTTEIDTDVAPKPVTEDKAENPKPELNWAQEIAGYTIVDGKIVRPPDEYTKGDVYQGPYNS